MIHKIIGHGSNGSHGVMTYMLRDPDDSSQPRFGMTVLRGDVSTQAKLIDSLVGQFKQQYVTGVFSFEEAPHQISAAQKNEIMDGAEQTILAGLDPDRVSITWIEHTDKGRLELNYIVACVDLKHGRLFQPYVHSHDKDRFNAFRDIQNIKNGFTEPNDPAKAQTFKRMQNLPKKTKELKEVIHAEIERMTELGLITNRADLKQAFTDFGFEVTRDSKSFLSIKNPNGGQNLKFKGKLYEQKFDISRESAAEISRASADFRASAGERFTAAQQVYKRELERKREYHQGRHSKPTLKQREYERELERSLSTHQQRARECAWSVPVSNVRYATNSVYELRASNERSDVDHRKAAGIVCIANRNDAKSTNRENTQNDQCEYDADARDYRTQATEIQLNDGYAIKISSCNNQRCDDINLDVRFDFGRSDNAKVLKTDTDRAARSRTTSNRLWQTANLAAFSKIIKNRQWQTLNYDEQTAIRPNSASISHAASDDRAAKKHDRQSEYLSQAKRQRYSAADEIIKRIGADAKRCTNSITDFTQRFREYDIKAGADISKNAKQSSIMLEQSEQLGTRAANARKCTDQASRDSDHLSEQSAELDAIASRYSAIRVKDKQLAQLTTRNRDIKKFYIEYTERNQQAVIECQRINRVAKQVIELEQQARQTAERERRYDSPSPF